MSSLSYPIGEYQPQPFSTQQKEAWLADIKFLPNELELALQNLDAFQLNTPYREGGWTVKQLVSHVTDSHMNALIRFRLALTEDTPTIKPYKQNEWVLLNDVETVPTNVFVTILHGVHLRWYETIKNLPDDTWQNKAVIHPEQGKTLTLWYLLGLYAWHCRHHVAHITALKSRMNW